MKPAGQPSQAGVAGKAQDAHSGQQGTELTQFFLPRAQPQLAPAMGALLASSVPVNSLAGPDMASRH